MFNFEELDEKAKELIRAKPAVHELCLGGDLTSALTLSENLYVVPIQSFVSEDKVNFMIRYARDLMKIDFDHEKAGKAKVSELLISSGVIAIICIPQVDGTSSEIEDSVKAQLELAKEITSIISIKPLTSFAIFINSTNGYYRFTRPMNLGPRAHFLGIKKLEKQELLVKVFKGAIENEHYRFGISLLNDAISESNPRFRIARLFNVLECFASENKSALPSRKAVRYLLGFNVDGEAKEWVIDGKKYCFDLIEIAGRLRDNLFHGARFTEDELNNDAKHAFPLLETHPMELADKLTGYCKAALYSWVSAD